LPNRWITPLRLSRDSAWATAVNGIPSKSAKRQARSPPASIRLRTISAVTAEPDPVLFAMLFMQQILA
jgi:hypothetical protein